MAFSWAIKIVILTTLIQNSRTCKKSGCSSDEFLCKSTNTCIDKSFVCDGYFHCPNREDENEACQGIPCEGRGILDMFTCNNGQCGFLCDQKGDCSDGSDEDRCFHSDVSIGCHIPLSKRCDGINHCRANVDERGC